jgi:hypothetical protein
MAAGWYPEATPRRHLAPTPCRSPAQPRAPGPSVRESTSSRPAWPACSTRSGRSRNSSSPSGPGGAGTPSSWRGPGSPRSGHGRTPRPSTNPNRETYVPPTVGVATVCGRSVGFPVQPGGRFAGRPVGWFPPSAGRLPSVTAPRPTGWGAAPRPELPRSTGGRSLHGSISHRQHQASRRPTVQRGSGSSPNWHQRSSVSWLASTA